MYVIIILLNVDINSLSSYNSIFLIAYSIDIFIIFADFNFCLHCKNFSSSEVNALLDHCKNCSFMHRPDLFRYKFICYGCKYFTYSRTNMKSHVMTHLGNKPYRCTLCSFSSSQPSNLKTHLKNVHSQL